ncbi:MAG: hypothetical protein JKX76_01210 [Colwellia sp.]|nr:hypothetical protein [Colwellia sp.]
MNCIKTTTCKKTIYTLRSNTPNPFLKLIFSSYIARKIRNNDILNIFHINEHQTYNQVTQNLVNGFDEDIRGSISEEQVIATNIKNREIFNNFFGKEKPQYSSLEMQSMTRGCNRISTFTSHVQPEHYSVYPGPRINRHVFGRDDGYTSQIPLDRNIDIVQCILIMFDSPVKVQIILKFDGNVIAKWRPVLYSSKFKLINFSELFPSDECWGPGIPVVIQHFSNVRLIINQSDGEPNQTKFNYWKFGECMHVLPRKNILTTKTFLSGKNSESVFVSEYGYLRQKIYRDSLGYEYCNVGNTTETFWEWITRVGLATELELMYNYEKKFGLIKTQNYLHNRFMNQKTNLLNDVQYYKCIYIFNKNIGHGMRPIPCRQMRVISNFRNLISKKLKIF